MIDDAEARGLLHEDSVIIEPTSGNTGIGLASVAAAYFNLIALDNELSIVRRTLITRSEGLYQVQLRFEGGLTSEMVYQQAKVEYASTAALIPDLER